MLWLEQVWSQFGVIFEKMLTSSWIQSTEIARVISLFSASIFMGINVSNSWFWLFSEITISQIYFLFHDMISWCAFGVLWIECRIRRRFHWCIGHWILIRLAVVHESRNIVREIQMSYFLILVMMRKTQIHSCFNNTIIHIYKIMLLSAIVWIP